MPAARTGRVAWGFSVHTGWAALVAVELGPAKTFAISDRRRIEMMPDGDPNYTRFVYHAASELRLDAAERTVKQALALSRANAEAQLRAAQETIAGEVVASCMIVTGSPPSAALKSILDNHSLIHAAEGALFRNALGEASRALNIPVIEVHAKDLRKRAATAFGVAQSAIDAKLAEIGQVAGKPWNKDYKEGCLAAVVGF